MGMSTMLPLSSFNGRNKTISNVEAADLSSVQAALMSVWFQTKLVRAEYGTLGLSLRGIEVAMESQRQALYLA